MAAAAPGGQRRHEAAVAPRRRSPRFHDGPRLAQFVARSVLPLLLLLLLLVLLGSGVIVGVTAAAPEGSYDDDREGGAGGAAASPAASGASILARRSHRLIGAGADGPAGTAPEGQPASMAVAGGGEAGAAGHEAYVAARAARMPLDLFVRVLHTSAEGELAGEDGLLHDALDFQWRLLAATPAKPAPFLVCGGYTDGRALAGVLRRDLGEARIRSVHTSRAGNVACLLAHATYAYAVGLLRHLSSPSSTRSKTNGNDPVPVTYVEPLPAHLKISPDFITYSAQDAAPAVGGAAAPRLKVARLQELQQGRSQAPTPAPTAAPTPAPTAAPTPTSPLELEKAGPELILTFSPGAKVGRHLQFLLKRWRKVLPKLGRLSTGGFQEQFFWTARPHARHTVDADEHEAPRPRQANVTSAEGAWHFEGRRAAWRATLARLQAMHTGNRTCGFEDVRFLDETETHVVLSGLGGASGGEDEEDEEDRHACLVGLVAFVAAHPEVLSVQMRARYRTQNDVASWIIQSGDERTQARPLWELGLTGEGELIGVSDTGLDDEHCFFYDPVQGRVARSTWEHPVTDMAQRKVVQYISFVDGGDFVEGHGTHVAGSIGGVLAADWAMHACGDGETLACTGACLTQDDCRLPEYNYRSCHDWRNDGHCDPWFSCPLHGCDGGDCASAACGADPAEALGRNGGLARAAKIAFFDLADIKGNLSTPSDFNRMLFPPAYDAGARIHSNSWGVNIGGYLFDDAQIDRFAYEHQDMLVIYAGGNYGEQGFHSIGSPGTTKNALTVGATESGPERLTQDREVVAKFSSRGPTYDGRLKPDVVAPGSYVYSARSAGYDNGGTCAYVAMAGTSMAAPVVAGVAALLRQYFKEGHYARALRRRGECGPPYASCEDEDGGFEPSAPLLKALFVNSAVPVKAFRLPAAGGRASKQAGAEDKDEDKDEDEDEGQEGEALVPLPHPPDLAQGHGRIKIDAALDFHGKHSLFLADRRSLRSGERHVYYFLVEEAGRRAGESDGGNDSDGVPLQVTLAWIDPPNAFTARKQLLHDLDLVVIDPAGKRHHPNGLPGPDERNNVEKVVIATPAAGGVYTLVVQAGELVEAEAQAYALVATGAGRAILEEVALPLIDGGVGGVGGQQDEDGAAEVPLDAVLHPCFSACLQQMPATGTSVCRQLAYALQAAAAAAAETSSTPPSPTGCRASCPTYAIAEARELCLGPHARCGLEACGVRLDTPAEVQSQMEKEGQQGDEGRFYKVAGRLVVRGLQEEDFFGPAADVDLADGALLQRELVAAIERWLGTEEQQQGDGRVSVRLVHVNGRAIPSFSDDGEEEDESNTSPSGSYHHHQQQHRRRLVLFGPSDPIPRFSSPQYGVAVGIEVLASQGKAQGRRLQARMGESYGHLNDFLRATATHPRLKRALAFDLQTHVASYRLLPAVVGARAAATTAGVEEEGGGRPALVFDLRREDEEEGGSNEAGQEEPTVDVATAAGAGIPGGYRMRKAGNILSSPLLMCLSIMMIVVGLASLAVEGLRRWLPTSVQRRKQKYPAQVHTEGVVVMDGKRGHGGEGGKAGSGSGCCKVLLVARSRCNTEDEEREQHEEEQSRRQRQQTADELIGEEFDWMRVRAPTTEEEEVERKGEKEGEGQREGSATEAPLSSPSSLRGE